jgi:hypothetical protein
LLTFCCRRPVPPAFHFDAQSGRRTVTIEPQLLRQFVPFSFLGTAGIAAWGRHLFIESPMHKAKNVPVERLPEEVSIAAYEFLAKVLKESADQISITLANVTNDGDPIGSFRISVRKLS